MRKIINICVTLCFLLLFTACNSETQEKFTMPPTEVGFMTLKTQTVKLEQELSGRVKASLKADVRPQVDGIIQERLFQEGQYVKAGQILYKIDSESYKATYNQALAALNSMEANIKAAQQKSERYTYLAKVDGVSQQDLDDAIAAYQQAKAAVEEKKALVATARINLERADIKASISGYIGISGVTQGALVTANQSEPLTVIHALDTVYVDIIQSSTQQLRLRQLLANNLLQSGSTEVELWLEDNTKYQHKGILQLQEIAVDESTGSVTLRAEFPNPEGLLLPGMYVRAIVNDANTANGILVKQQAITWNAKGEAIAMVVTDNNTVEQRTVFVGPAIGDTWLIPVGLSAGNRLIIEGLNKIKAGDTVLPVELNTENNS